HTSIFGEDTLGAVAHYNALAALNRVMGNYTQAFENARRALAICNEHRQPRHAAAATAHENLAAVCRLAGAHATAEFHWQEALSIPREHGARAQAARTMNNLGVLAFQQERLEEAERFFRDALIIQNELAGKRQERYSTLCNLAGVLHRRGRLNEAIELVE